MMNLSMALVVMIVRIVIYLVQQHKETQATKKIVKSKQDFIRQIEHPAEHFIHARRILSYEKFMFYIRN